MRACFPMRALVTGAAGHLGTSLTELLVARGHQVRAALRGSDDPKKTGPLRKLGVEVVEADVLDAAAVERAAQGMDALFHLAAVFRFVTDDPDAIIEPAVRGAEHALRAAKKAGIGRVVLTSSAVAVGTRRLQDRPLDERDWNDAATNAYGRAKTLAERKAWALAGEIGVDLVCLNPTCLLGPGFTRHTPITLPVAQMVFGEAPVTVAIAANYVDTRDVALAHLAAFETAGASGRYVLSAERKRAIEIARAQGVRAHGPAAVARGAARAAPSRPGRRLAHAQDPRQATAPVARHARGLHRRPGGVLERAGGGRAWLGAAALRRLPGRHGALHRGAQAGRLRVRRGPWRALALRIARLCRSPTRC